MLIYISSETHPLSQNTIIHHSSLMVLVVLMILDKIQQFLFEPRQNISWILTIHVSGSITPSCLLLSTLINATSVTYTWLFLSERKSLRRLLRKYQSLLQNSSLLWLSIWKVK